MDKKEFDAVLAELENDIIPTLKTIEKNTPETKQLVRGILIGLSVNLNSKEKTA